MAPNIRPFMPMKTEELTVENAKIYYSASKMWYNFYVPGGNDKYYCPCSYRLA